jgi:2-dehydro-3-deoxygluconokinase
LLTLKPAADCQFDIVSLGEIMLRLDPGNGRIRTARSFDIWEGGGEYNVARGLSRCFGQRAAVVTAFARNEVGRLLESLVLAGGVHAGFIHWVQPDGAGRKVRNGLNFVERGFGVRAALGVSDRGHSAASQLKPGDIDWEHLFGQLGVRWFHTGGIFAALSPTTPSVIREAMTVARRHGTVCSYDLNFRGSLWNDFGGLPACRQVNRDLAPLVDVMIGNEEDFTNCLGLTVAGADPDRNVLPVEAYKSMMDDVTRQFPNLSVTATTLRTAWSASRNDWGALCWHQGQVYESALRRNLEIFDRVGGGDSFASGLIYGFLCGLDAGQAVEYGAAHGALAMTTPGDTSMASLEEVEALVTGQASRVRR